MKINDVVKLVIAIVVAEGAGITGAVFTMPAIRSGWYAMLVKPALNPPAWVFGPVWTTLYFLLGLAFFIVWKNNFQIKNSDQQNRVKAWNKWSWRLWAGDWKKFNIVAIFFVQLGLNILWSFIFFGTHNPGLAFFELTALWVSIVYLMINFRRVSKLSAWLLAPYILWVSFALYLNYAIWTLN